MAISHSYGKVYQRIISHSPKLKDFHQVGYTRGIAGDVMGIDYILYHYNQYNITYSH